MRWSRTSCRSFWIQNGLWAIFGCWYISKTFWVVFEKIQNFNFFKKHPKLFAYKSATRYCSEAVVYSKGTAGYHLSPHLKTIVVFFFYKLSNKATKKLYFENFGKTPKFGGILRTPKIFFRVLQIISRVLQLPIFRNSFCFGGKVFTFSVRPR